MKEDRNIQIYAFSENISSRRTIVGPNTQTPYRTYLAYYIHCSATANDIKHNKLANLTFRGP
jgi:hypothetical protein